MPSCFAEGSVEFTAPSSMVDEGMTAMGCCVRISSTATALGCEVQVMLMTMNGKAGNCNSNIRDP